VTDRRGDGAGRYGEDLYLVLGVAPGADAAELARAYRRRLRQLHPDTRSVVDTKDVDGGGRGGPGQSADPSWELTAVQDAYRVLRDPARRARYDTERRRNSEPRQPAPTGPAAEDGVGPPRPVSIPVRRGCPGSERWLLRVGSVQVRPLPSPPADDRRRR
jgi:curved DNA-binding protein CbpA